MIWPVAHAFDPYQQNMALLYTKSCQCQKPDKAFCDGVFSIRPDHCSWEPSKAGMAPPKQFLLRDLARE